MAALYPIYIVLTLYRKQFVTLNPSPCLHQGWRFGAIHGRSGIFPAELVQPVAAPDFINLPVDRKEEPKNRQGQVAASASVVVAVASSVAAHELEHSIEVHPPPSTLRTVSLFHWLFSRRHFQLLVSNETDFHW